MNRPISETTGISDTEMRLIISDAVASVFSTMVMFDVTADPTPATGYLSHFTDSVSGIVGFAGKYSGTIALHCRRPFAVRTAESMLGVELDDQNSEDVYDAIGEIANMLAGQIKQHLSKGGTDIQLSTPTIISGADYSVSAIADHNCLACFFLHKEEPFATSLILKND